MGIDLYLIGIPGRTASLERFKTWFQDRCVDEIEKLVVDQDAESHDRLSICLHPAAEDLEVTWRGDSILVGARTSPGGPGYHLYVADLLQNFGREFEIEWLPPTDEDDSPCDDTGYFFSGDRRLVRPAFDEWLKLLAEHAANGIENGESDGIQLCMPLNNGFVSLEAAMTPLGPRSLDWLKRTASDPSEGQDFYVWPNEDKDVEYFRRRALVHLWSDIRWRKPFREEEWRVLRRTDQLLRDAWHAHSQANLPWREWLEVRRLASICDQLDDQILSNASCIVEDEPLAGYRRFDVHHQLPGAWSLKIPGAFAAWWEDEVWRAGDGDRTIHLSLFQVLDEGRPRAANAIIASHEHLHGWTREHTAGKVTGRADFAYDQSEKRWNLQAISAAPGKVVLLTVSVPAREDENWAVAIWKSLTNPGETAG